MSGVFPSLAGLARLLPVLDGADRLVLVDLPRVLDAAAAEPASAGSPDAASAGTPDAAEPASAGTPDAASPDRPARSPDDPRHVDRTASPADGGQAARSAALALAARIRLETDGQVEPRNVAGYWDVAARYGLLVEGADHRLRLTRRGRAAVVDPQGPALGTLAVREGLAHLAAAVGAGHQTLAALLPGWRAVLAGNPRFAAAPSHPRSLGQRVAALVRDGWLVAHGDHAARLADEAGFRRREPEPAFADLAGGLTLSAAGQERLARCRRAREPGASPGGGGEAS